ncbi:MAG: hypothetical protein JWM11_3742 [Planctomycetaceae bacterium]|nr:hypothetical protein [Planctomycetaceae bacterium]
MNTKDPFPSVRMLAHEVGQTWTGYDLAANGTAKAEKALLEALHSAPGGDRILGPDVSLVLCGSFARYEMLSGSDYDWSLLIDGVVNNSHAVLARTIETALKNKELPSPGTSGTFGNMVFSHELVHRIGGGADSNANLTRRMLMLLESRPISLSAADASNDVWENVLNNILERYFEEDVHFAPASERKIPRFLFNDLTRYWRTIGVDYAAKHREQDGHKWAIRNAKLRLSRKLLFASGMAFCLGCQLAPPTQDGQKLFAWESGITADPFIKRARAFSRTPALEYLAAFVDSFVTDKPKRAQIAQRVFGTYSEWLELMNDKNNRDILEKLNHSDANQNVVFEKVRVLGSEFAKGLELLFFNQDHQTETDPIARLSLQYIGF